MSEMQDCRRLATMTARAEAAEKRVAEMEWAAEELAADLTACTLLLAQAQSDLADERDRHDATMGALGAVVGSLNAAARE